MKTTGDNMQEIPEGKARGREKGMVLIFAFIIMTTLTAITVAFLYMTSTRLKGSAYGLQSSKAFWISEGGIQDVIYRFKSDSGYRADPTAVSGNLGDGSYSVSVTKNGNTYTLTSTGIVGALDRQITQNVVVTVAFTDAFDYAVFGNTNNNTLKIKDNVTVSGDVYYDGDIEVMAGANVTNGLVYADSVSGGGTYTEASGPPDPVPAYPTFDTTWYDNKITTAESQAAGDWTLSGSDTYDLDGSTVYYNGKVTVKNNAIITGSGTIVATDDVKIQNSANISPSVTIISKKKITVKNDAVVQSGTVLYGRNEVKLKDSANVTGSLIVPTSNKNVKMQNDSNFTGIIYADKVELKGSAVISGSVVVNEYNGNQIKDDVNITFDQSSLPGSVPTGLQAGSVTVAPQIDWNEIVPAI